jgi:hypothetical protein
MLAGIAWCLARLNPSQRGLILVVFALSNVVECLPSLGRSLLDWWQAPANPIWISNFVMYALFVFIAIPLSVLGGGRRPIRSTSDRIH